MKSRAIKILYSAALLGLFITIPDLGGTADGGIIPFDVINPWFPK